MKKMPLVLMQRREAAKQLGITASMLKELEAAGAVVPVRDEQRRIRYTPEVVAMAREMIAGGEFAMGLNIAQVPAPVIAASAPAAVTWQPAQLPPSRPVLDEDALDAFIERALSLLDAEYGPWGRTGAEVLTEWSQKGMTSPPPDSFLALVGQGVEAHGVDVQTFVSSLMQRIWDLGRQYAAQHAATLSSDEDDWWGGEMTPEQEEPIRSQPFARQMAASTAYTPVYSPPSVPQYPVPQWSTAPPTMSQMQWHTPQRPQRPMIAWGTGYRPTQSNYAAQMPRPLRPVATPTRNSPLTLAREGVELQQLEIERRRLERMQAAEDTEQDRHLRAEQEAQARIFEQQELARRQAEKQYELQRRELEVKEAARREQAAREDAERRMMQERERQVMEQEQREMLAAQEVEMIIAATLRNLPSEMSAAEVSQVREDIERVSQGRTPEAVRVLSRDIAARMSAPIRARASHERVAEQLRVQILTCEAFVLSDYPPEVKDKVARAVDEYLASHPVENKGFVGAIGEVRAVRDRVIEGL